MAAIQQRPRSPHEAGNPQMTNDFIRDNLYFAQELRPVSGSRVRKARVRRQKDLVPFVWYNAWRVLTINSNRVVTLISGERFQVTEKAAVAIGSLFLRQLKFRELLKL